MASKPKPPPQPNAAAAASPVQLFFYGCVGAIAPDIVQLYAKRWTAPSLDFSLAQYLFATLIYVLLAGVLGMLFAKTRPTALTVGIGTPLIIGALLSTVKGMTVAPARGAGDIEAGTLLDLLTLW